MSREQSETLEEPKKVSRILGEIHGSQNGPTVIFIGGIHGNEPAGVHALNHVFNELKGRDASIRGSIYALSGNLGALERGVRFQTEDLNRLWSMERMKEINSDGYNAKTEDAIEQLELYTSLQKILKSGTGPYYFMDLHTTSCETIPFITVNDNLLNRKFTSLYPLPIVLGIEEYLDGPVLSYINEMGFVAFGFEGGQHDDPNAVKNHEAFIYLSLIFAGCVEKDEIEFAKQFEWLYNYAPENRHFFEIFHRHEIAKSEKFSMWPIFINFQQITKGTPVAVSNGASITAPASAQIFMPLYQDQGDDGFFLIRKIPRFFLKLSAVLRKWRFERFLTWLPGVSWLSKEDRTLVVNLKVARFLAKRIFHLLGYRSRTLDKTHYVMKAREAASRDMDYLNANWM